MKKKISKKKTGNVKAKGVRQRVRSRAIRALDKGLSVVAPSVKDIRGLSRRDNIFVRNLLSGMDKISAMKLASEAIGVQTTEFGARNAADKSLSRPEVDTAIVQALQAVGVDDALIAGKLKDGLDATAFTQTGIEHQDFKTRLGYIQTILKVKGQMAPDIANQQQVLNYTSFKDDE